MVGQGNASCRRRQKALARFEYHNNNQLARAIRENDIETFEWDGLALIERSGTKYINEPHPGCGNPILAIGDNTEAIFTDMLGTSLGTVRGREYSQITKTSFGADSNSADSFFTGKPHVEDLGYAFLFRNYRADISKWLTQDLIGYPEGWNNLAYCGNSVIANIDYNGLWTVQIGITFSGGAIAGGTTTIGIAFGYSSEAGFSAGWFESVGGGTEFGAGASISGELSISNAASIEALAGTALSVGASFGEGPSIGGEITTSPSSDIQSATFTIGFGLGTPAEIHTFITETFVQEITTNGGIVDSINE